MNEEMVPLFLSQDDLLLAIQTLQRSARCEMCAHNLKAAQAIEAVADLLIESGERLCRSESAIVEK